MNAKRSGALFAVVLLVVAIALVIARFKHNEKLRRDADAAFRAMVADCKSPLYTDKQKIPNNDADADNYSGGLMCAVPAVDLSTLSGASYTMDTPVPVAYVDVSSDDKYYSDDGFRVGRNCIYIMRRKGRSGDNISDLEAIYQLLPANLSDCRRFSPDYYQAVKGHLRSGGSDTLPPAKPPYGDSVPAVVRIDMDYPGGRHIIIGLRCLKHEWCLISKKGGNVAHQDSQNAYRRLPGWYDEQYLGVEEDNGNAKVVKPSNLYASIYPKDSLGYIVHGKYPDLVKVAVVKFQTQDAQKASSTLKYYATTKWGMPANSPDLGPDDSVTLQLKATSPDLKHYTARWVVYRTSAAGTLDSIVGHNKQVIYHGDGDPITIKTHITAAATRWGWDAQDESAWVRCSEGCCNVTSEDDPPTVVPPAIAQPKKKP